MDLILWRHADAQELEQGIDDPARGLTAKGYKQARRVAEWLNRFLPEGTRVLCSPALRSQQTAEALGRKFKLMEALRAWSIKKGSVWWLRHRPREDRGEVVLVAVRSPEQI